jgi:hypothetical protein
VTDLVSNLVFAAISALVVPKPSKGKGNGKKKSSEAMSIVKAEFILEKQCYIAFLNRHYQNPPLATSTLNCIAAKRALPCSLCASRTKKTIDFSGSRADPTISPIKSCISICAPFRRPEEA